MKLNDENAALAEKVWDALPWNGSHAAFGMILIRLAEAEKELKAMTYERNEEADQRVAEHGRAKTAEAERDRLRDTLEGTRADVDRILGLGDALGLAEEPGNEIPDEAYNLAASIRLLLTRHPFAV